jgi:hypothetical protein
VREFDHSGDCFCTCALINWTVPLHKVWNLVSGTLEKVHDVEFDETNNFQEEDENLDDVRGLIDQCNEEDGCW